MAEIYTIQETVELPSHGKLYKDVPESLTLRSMTTEEEMRRLSQKDSYYKRMCDVVDACIIEPMTISSYDMCLGDYQALLYGLRTVTYGSVVTNSTICPYCGALNNEDLDLYSLEKYPFKELTNEDFEIKLPRSQSIIRIKLHTPRILDEIDKEIEDYKANNKQDSRDPSLLITLKHSIEYVDGEHYDPIKLDMFLRKLPMADTNVLAQKVLKFNDNIGINTNVKSKCDSCGQEYPSSFRITPEFFGPTID